MSIQRVNEMYDNFNNGNNRIESLVEFKKATTNAFFEMAFSLTDEEKIRLMAIYSFDKNIITNLICKLSNDELKLQSIRKFEIIAPFQLQVIVRTLNDSQNQLNLIKEFNLEKYCEDIIAKLSLDEDTNKKPKIS